MTSPVSRAVDYVSNTTLFGCGVFNLEAGLELNTQYWNYSYIFTCLKWNQNMKSPFSAKKDGEK